MHQTLSQGEETNNRFSRSAPLPSLAGVSLIEHNHARLAIGGGQPIDRQASPILHRDILKTLAPIQGF
jgi:hypothetical protein